MPSLLLLGLLTATPVADFNAGVAAEGRGELPGAVVLLDRAARALPGWGLPKIELAEVLLKEGGGADRALLLLDAAALLGPQSPRLFQLRGLALAEKGNPAGAEAAERSALALRPDFPEAEAALADALWSQGKTAEALGHWQALSQRYPTDLSNRALLVDRLLEGGRPVEAEKELRALAADQPQNPVWHRRLARTLDAEGLPADAALERERAARLAGQPVAKRRLRRLPDSRR